MTNVKTYRNMTEQEKKFLREQLKITRDGHGVLRRAHNILQLTSIPRTYKGKHLKTFQLEGQVKLFTTTWGENCYYKFPGRESLRIGRYNCPYDFRPVCPKSLLTGDASKDFSAEEIFLTTFEKYFIKMLFERSEESYLNVLRSKIYHIGVANTSFA